MKRGSSFGAIDIGSAKTTFIFGEVVGSNFTIKGHCVCKSDGIKKGAPSDLKLALDAVKECIKLARKQHNNLPDKIFLAQSGRGLKSLYSKTTINSHNADSIIDSADLERAKKEAIAKKPSAGTLFLHHFFQCFSINDEFCENPIGKKSNNLAAEYCSIYGDEQAIRDNLFIVNQLGFRVEELVFAGIASSLAVTTPIEREYGICTIDIGAETTTYTVYKNKNPISAGTIPIGGVNFTNDLCSGLRLHFDDGEELKLRLGIPPLDTNNENIWIKGDHSIGDKIVNVKNIYKILHARAEELFECVYSNIKQNIGINKPFLNLILTGGGSQLKNIATIAAKVFETDCETRSPLISINQKIKTPAFSTCIGLLHFATNIQKSTNIPTKKSTIISKLSEWFNI